MSPHSCSTCCKLCSVLTEILEWPEAMFPNLVPSLLPPPPSFPRLVTLASRLQHPCCRALWPLHTQPSAWAHVPSPLHLAKACSRPSGLLNRSKQHSPPSFPPLPLTCHGGACTWARSFATGLSTQTLTHGRDRGPFGLNPQ
jgi:hypothetical protein